MVEDKSRLLALAKEHITRRLAGGTANLALGTERIDLKLVDHLKLEARKRQFIWIVDEPQERGGTDEGPNPLAYFLSGAASCLMMQFALIALKNDVVLDNCEVTARAHYTLPVGGEFQEIIYDMRVRSNSPTNKILNLVQKAEELCFVHNTFKNTRIRVVTNVILNDRKIR